MTVKLDVQIEWTETKTYSAPLVLNFEEDTPLKDVLSSVEDYSVHEIKAYLGHENLSLTDFVQNEKMEIKKRHVIIER